MQLSKESLDIIIEMLAEETVKLTSIEPKEIAIKDTINYIHNSIDDYNTMNQLTQKYIYLVKQYTLNK